MEDRFAHFETLCLPGLKAQTDQDFTFVLLVGEAMPAVYLARLEALVDGFAQAVILRQAPMAHRKACREAINAVRDMRQPCLQFRHDDDDAVAVDFVACLRAAARDCDGLLRAHRYVGFDWGGGFVARPDAGGLCAEAVQHPYWGVAQAMAVRAGTRQTIMNFRHSKLNHHMPTVTFNTPAMYVRGYNGYNDSRSDAPVLPRLDEAGEALFKQRFAIDADAVRRVFGG